MQLLCFDRSGMSVVGMNFWYVCRTEGPHVEVLEVAYKAAPAMAPRPANFFANPNILLKICMYICECKWMLEWRDVCVYTEVVLSSWCENRRMSEIQQVAAIYTKFPLTSQKFHLTSCQSGETGLEQVLVSVYDVLLNFALARVFSSKSLINLTS